MQIAECRFQICNLQSEFCNCCGPCAGRPLSGEERTVGYHNDANQTVGVIGAAQGFGFRG